MLRVDDDQSESRSRITSTRNAEGSNFFGDVGENQQHRQSEALIKDDDSVQRVDMNDRRYTGRSGDDGLDFDKNLDAASRNSMAMSMMSKAPPLNCLGRQERGSSYRPKAGGEDDDYSGKDSMYSKLMRGRENTVAEEEYDEEEQAIRDRERGRRKTSD